MLPLQQLATNKFGSLTAAELKLLEAATTGSLAQCGSANEQGGFSKSGWIWSWILQGTIGFGYRSHRTLLWALGLVILGAFLFNEGYQAGFLVPPKPDTKTISEFNAIGYSLDSFLPIINLHQEELWVPSGFGGGRWIQYYYWFHICLGWALITLGVAGFTGLVRKE